MADVGEPALEESPVDRAALEEDPSLQSPDGPEVPLPHWCQRREDCVADDRDRGQNIDRGWRQPSEGTEFHVLSCELFVYGGLPAAGCSLVAIVADDQLPGGVRGSSDREHEHRDAG